MAVVSNGSIDEGVRSDAWDKTTKTMQDGGYDRTKAPLYEHFVDMKKDFKNLVRLASISRCPYPSTKTTTKLKLTKKYWINMQ